MSGLEEVIEGLKIFAKYGGDISAEHDTIYAGPNRLRDEHLSKEDEARLVELNWGFNDGLEVWYKFV